MGKKTKTNYLVKYFCPNNSVTTAETFTSKPNLKKWLAQMCEQGDFDQDEVEIYKVMYDFDFEAQMKVTLKANT